MIKPRWDIFCKVVDNFGDIGICWRLARQLENEHALQVRLWVDNLEIAQKIIPIININKQSQFIDNIEILVLNTDANFLDVPGVVVETFSCGLPKNYQHAMTKKQSKWVNLEYLSAESWVDDFHAKPSPQTNGLTRYFYFPGFTENTGGLIRERNIEVGRETKIENTLKISLFCYPNAPIHDLFDAFAESTKTINCYVPASSILPQIVDYFGVETIDVGDYLSRENLHVHILPFMSQADYDQLLRDCDLNFVRGEDSWIRAIWAGKPFIWQPYIQDENAHMKKLEAFLNLFYVTYAQKELPCEAHRYWSAGQLSKHVLDDYLSNLNAIHTHTRQQSAALAKQQDLAAKLVIFCNKL